MLPTRIRLLPVLVTLLVAFAGCTDGGKKAKDASDVSDADFEQLELEATSTTGVIRGVVFDEAIRPIADALVFATGAAGSLLNVSTNEAGLFGIDGLEGGTYFLQVTKPGFIPTQQSVDVVVGDADPQITKVLLTIDPGVQPRVAEYQYEAFIACSFTFPVVSVAACGLPGVADATDNRFLVEYDADQPPTWIQTEAVWKSTNPFGGNLGLTITDFRGAQITVNSTDGPSPIYITVNATRALEADYGGDNPINIRLFSTTADGTDQVDEQIVQDAYAGSPFFGAYNSTPAPGIVYMFTNTSIPGLGKPLSDPFSKECIKYPVLFNACLRFGGFGAVINQQVQVYTHVFYGYQPPADWRFSTHGPPPPPPSA